MDVFTPSLPSKPRGLWALRAITLTLSTMPCIVSQVTNYEKLAGTIQTLCETHVDFKGKAQYINWKKSAATVPYYPAPSIPGTTTIVTSTDGFK